MPYATRAQIEARLPSVVVASESFDATITEALEWADSRVDEGLGSRYPVPFASPYPKSVKQLAADFAAVFVFRSASESEASQAYADNLEKSLERRIQQLLKAGIPELEETGEDLPLATGVAEHSAFGQTSEIAALDWSM